MQKKHLMAGSAIGGFLLATTALTSTASAQALLATGDTVDATNGVDPDYFGSTFATERFAGTGGASATVGVFDVIYSLGGSFENGTVRLQIDTSLGSFLTGVTASSAASAAVSAAPVVAGSNANVVSAIDSFVSVAVTSISAFGGQISVTYVLPASSPVRGLQVESLKLAQVQGLSAASTALTLTSSLFTGDSGTASATDTLTIGTSGAVHSVSAATAGTLTANATATVPFAGLVDAAGTGSTTVGTLATINVIGASAQARSLDAADSVEDLVSAASGLNITATSELLTQSAVTRAQVAVNGANTTATVSTGLISTEGTFTVTSVEPTGNYVEGTTSIAVQAVFDGTTAITTASAGTVAATLIGTATSVLSTASGTTASVVRNGIVAEVNYFQGSGDSFGGVEGAFQSFLRISNSGTVAGAATITAVDPDGNTVGSFTTPEIPVNGQIQISNVALEQGDDTYTGLGIAGGVTSQYTVLITGPFQGYVQHVQLNNTNSGFTNLSGFRGNSGSANTLP